MFCWKQKLHPALLSSLWSYRIASTQKTDVPQNPLKLSQQAQRAAWAVKIINTINQSQPEECIYSPSLRQKLLSLTTPHSSYAFDPQVKEEVLQMFKEGIQVPYQVFRQQRFLNAGSGRTDDLRIVFCPNYLVTQQMFRLVDKHIYLLVSGNFGISKSISLALYSTLSMHINLYYSQVDKYSKQARQQTIAEEVQKLKTGNDTNKEIQHKEQIKEINLKEEMNNLIEQNILQKPWKFWYWTINLQDIKPNGWRRIQQSFILQAYQLSTEQKKDLQKCQNLSQFLSKLKFYYPTTKFSNRVIIDQINGLASLMRKWNQLVEKIKGVEESEAYLYQDTIRSHQKQYYYPAKELIAFFYEITQLGAGYILNSSVNIEKTLLIDSKKNKFGNGLSKNLLKLNIQPLVLPILGNHDEVSKIQMKYSENLRQNWGKNDFFHFFWFEVESLLKQKVSTERLATAGRIFLSAASERQGKGYYRTIYIKRYLKNVFDKIQANVDKLKATIQQLPTQLELNESSCQEKLLQFFTPKTLAKMFPTAFKAEKEEQKTPPAKDSSLKATQEHPLVKLFNRMFDEFDRQCLNWQKERVQAFMDKGDFKQKLRFMMAVYSLAEQALIKNEKLKFPVSYLGSVVGKDVAAHFLSEQHNQQLLPVDRNMDDDEFVDFLWTPAEFIELTIAILSPQLYLIHKTLFGSFLLKANSIQPLFRGIFFQLLFLYQLNPKTVIKFKMFNQNWIIDNPVLILKSQKFVSFNDQILKQIYEEIRQNKLANKTKDKQLFYLETGKQAEIPEKTTTSQSEEEKKIIPFDVDLHFKEILEQCDNNKRSYVSGVPFYKEIFTHNNKCVDFVLAIKKSKVTTIYTFDLTVSTKVEKKITDAKNFLKNLAAQAPEKFQFVHIIFAPQEACKEKITITPNLSIQFSEIDSFEMENVTYPGEYQLLKILKENNKKLREKKAQLSK